MLNDLSKKGNEQWRERREANKKMAGERRTKPCEEKDPARQETQQRIHRTAVVPRTTKNMPRLKCLLES